MFWKFSQDQFTLNQCYHGRLWKQFLHQWKHFFFIIQKFIQLLCFHRARIFSVRLGLIIEGHQPNISPPHHYSGRLQKHFWQQQWKIFRSKFGKIFRIAELFLVKVSSIREKTKINLRKASKHILLKFCENWIFLNCLKNCFLKILHTERW